MSQERAQQVLGAIGARPATNAASGRYQRSLPFRPGIRYWATTLERSHADKFGVQFLGEGIPIAKRLERAFVRRGFVKQSTQPTQITYCRVIEWLPDDGIDVEAVRAARAEVDAVLNEPGNDRDESREARPDDDAAPSAYDVEAIRKMSFREFMLNSPLAGVDLELPSREGKWRDIDL